MALVGTEADPLSVITTDVVSMTVNILTVLVAVALFPAASLAL